MQLYTIHPAQPRINMLFMERLFAAKAVNKAGVIRRAKRDVHKHISRVDFIAEVKRRGFHLIECGGQYVILCNDDDMTVLC